MPVGILQAPGTCAQASRMTAVAEADFGKGLLPHPEDKKGVIHCTCIAKPFFLFSPSSLRWLCPNCLMPIARGMNPWAKVGTEPESTSQKCPRDGAAVLVTVGQPSARSHDFIYGYPWNLDASWVPIQQHI